MSRWYVKPTSKTVRGEGDACPRCSRPTTIKEHIRKPARASYYSRWFLCENGACPTTNIMPERYKVGPGIVIEKGLRFQEATDLPRLVLLRKELAATKDLAKIPELKTAIAACITITKGV